MPLKITEEKSQGTGTGHDLIYCIRRTKHVRRKVKVTKKSWKNYTDESMEEEANKIDWDNIFTDVNSKRKLDDATTQLHDNINWVINI